MAQRHPSDLTGMRFDYLSVLGRGSRDGEKGVQYWLCRCELCGSLKEVARQNLTGGHIRSCGCLRTRSRQAKQSARPGPACVFRAWKRMFYTRNRLMKESPGVVATICPAWHDFLKFRDWSLNNGFSSDHRVFFCRINTSAGFSPDNCRWVVVDQANGNPSHARLLTYRGVTQSTSAWARLLKVNRTTLLWRMESWNTTDLATLCSKPFGRPGCERYIDVDKIMKEAHLIG